jgi:hypothetical protein
MTVGDLPLREAFEQEHIAAVLFDGGVFLVDLSSEHVAKVHVAALPHGRGRNIVEAARELGVLLIERMGFDAVEGWTPSDNRAARHFNRAVGAVARAEEQGHTLYMVGRSQVKEWSHG